MTNDIFALAQEFDAHIQANWQQVLEKHHAKLEQAYAEAGDSAFGTYLTLLLRPIHRRLKEMGLKVKPRLPGDFNSSREWGVPAGDNEQRWMWSTVVDANGARLGTLVTITYHDHTQFRLPRPPHLFALAEVGEEAVVAALSARSAQFKDALPFTEEYALYLQSLEGESG
jgi:hypothetical protein